MDNHNGFVGQYVHKVGDATGWTWGQILNTCVDHHFGAWLIFGGYYVTECAYEATYRETGGDSGGPVFTLDGNGYAQSGDIVKLMGIHFGHIGETGPAVFSKWGRVVMDFGTTLNPLRGSSLSPPSLSGSTLFTGPSMSWSPVSGATRYNIYRVKLGVAEVLGTTTGTSFADGSSNVLAYTGASPTPGWNNNIQYFIYAVSGTEISTQSNVIWYKGASGTFSVSIGGPTVVGPNNYQCSVWVAQVSGASAITSYSWSGLFTSGESYVQGTVPTSGGSLQLIVVDDQGRQGGYVAQIIYDPANQDYCV